MRDFFISYAAADLAWAKWISRILEAAGHTTIYQDRDFLPGQNFLVRMNDSMGGSARTISILSNAYLAKLFTMAEWNAGFAADPDGRKRKLFPVRIEPCELPPAYRAVIYCDLVGCTEDGARTRLLGALGPQSTMPVAEEVAAFPGTPAPPLRAESNDVRVARQLLRVLETSRTTFVAQARLRDLLYYSMRARLGITDVQQYEPFFATYFASMNEEERRQHDVIRAYTKNALSEFNQRALDLVESAPDLVVHVPRVKLLREHLAVWLAKYRGVFPSTPSMSLVYVGVNGAEGIPFPRGIEEELSAYIGAAT